MPKHKKFIKSEKAKVKLKGVKLPKGLNVTKTEFKVKKIIIKEQLIDQQLGTPTDGQVIRQQNVKDLLSKLQHHNASYRSDGIRYLKEMLTVHQEETNKHFGAIVHGLAQLCLDIERDVRKEGFKALAMLLSTTSAANTVAPFFDTLSSYLRCAMSHIQTPIQEDSLFMLDSLLTFVPQLVAENSDKIFSSFLDMISRLRVESKPERTLSTNLGSKMTSVKWRSKVLDRMLGMLVAMVNAKKQQLKLNSGGGNMENYVMQSVGVGGVTDDAVDFSYDDNVIRDKQQQQQQQQKSVSNIINYYDAKKPMHFSLTRRYLNQNCFVPGLFRKTISNSTQISTIQNPNGDNSYKNELSSGFIDEGKRMQYYATVLMPLMFETWIEVRPPEMTTKNGVEFADKDLLISNEAAFTLKIILEIIERIYELIKLWDSSVNNCDLSSWFCQTYNKDFCGQIFMAFPYSQADGQRIGGKRKVTKGVATDQDVKESGGSKCFYQNLSIAFLFTCFNETMAIDNTINQQSIKMNHHQIDSTKRVLVYLNGNLRIGSTDNDISMNLLKVLRTILLENGLALLQTHELEQRTLLAKVLIAYKQQKIAKEIRTKVLILLCDIVLNVKLTEAYGAELFNDWIITLPELLCQPYVSHHVLSTFSCLGKQRNSLFLKNLEIAVPKIIANLSTIQVTGIDGEYEGKKLIINLLYWIRWTSWEKKSSKLIDALEERLREYIRQMIEIKSMAFRKQFLNIPEVRMIE